MMDVGRVHWSPVLHMDKAGGKLLLFYSESRLCPRPPPGWDPNNLEAANAEAPPASAPPPPPGWEPGDDPQRWVPAYGHQSQKGRENIPTAGTNRGRGERIQRWVHNGGLGCD
eukprot:335345-Prorocentrum_minimum.AAC.1